MNNLQNKPFDAGKKISFKLDQMRPANAKSVLIDLFELLEEYGPTWYTEELHDRAVAALLNRAS
jgi:hypothetical protein